MKSNKTRVQRLFTAIKMYDNSVAFVRFPKAFNQFSVSYYEYYDRGQSVRAVMKGGTSIVIPVHARIAA